MYHIAKRNIINLCICQSIHLCILKMDSVSHSQKKYHHTWKNYIIYYYFVNFSYISYSRWGTQIFPSRYTSLVGLMIYRFGSQVCPLKLKIHFFKHIFFIPFSFSFHFNYKISAKYYTSNNKNIDVNSLK